MKGGLSLFILIWAGRRTPNEGRTFIIYFNLGLAGELLGRTFIIYFNLRLAGELLMKGGLSLFILI